MMKRLHLIIFIALLSGLTAVAKKHKQLVILHTNDTHSCILPLKEALGDTMIAGRGGYLRRIAMVKEEREKEPGLLLFDSGDFSQGSSYYTMFKGEVEVEMMNAMGYDATTIGNHEFDFGLENMAEMFKKATFPILCANYDFTDRRSIQPPPIASSPLTICWRATTVWMLCVWALIRCLLQTRATMSAS